MIQHKKNKESNMSKDKKLWAALDEYVEKRIDQRLGEMDIHARLNGKVLVGADVWIEFDGDEAEVFIKTKQEVTV
jgi:hypothetical protein